MLLGMNISIVDSWPKKDPKKLIALLLPQEQLAEMSTLLSKVLGETVSLREEDAEKGKKNLNTVNGQLLAIIGLGATPSLETLRRNVHEAIEVAIDFRFKELLLVGDSNNWTDNEWVAIVESLSLSTYQFLTYKSKKTDLVLHKTSIFAGRKNTKALAKGLSVAKATCIARDLVNEPVITLTAQELGHRIETLGKQYGFKVDVWNKSKIKAMKMGGLLAVNLGSQDPPTFSILEHKPETPINQQPIILVGKGVVYDTGGLSLKPTANSMDFMKCDMAGAAVVVGVMCGIVDLGLNYHVIGLIPATDNRPGQRAYTPGDVIQMHSGSTVEILNTDAEGRMILADALSYAKNYKPELVIDLATLTGAAVVAIGHEGIAMMSTASEETKQALKQAGERVHERLVELPLWEEYQDQLKSDIADLKNLGGRGAGAITAAKFLQHFTDYPWIHLDIAGAAWLSTASSYRGKNGTGVGTRLLIDFISQYQANNG